MERQRARTFVVRLMLFLAGASGALLAADRSPRVESQGVESCLTCTRAADVEACHRKAVGLAEERDYQGAIAIEERVHALEPGNAEVAAALAKMYQQGPKNVARAVALYHHALGVSSGFPPALLGLGSIMQDQGKMEIAERYFARGAKERPDLPVFRVRQADVLMALGRGDEAQPILRDIVEKWPNTGEAESARKMMSRTTLARP